MSVMEGHGNKIPPKPSTIERLASSLWSLTEQAYGSFLRKALDLGSLRMPTGTEVIDIIFGTSITGATLLHNAVEQWYLMQEEIMNSDPNLKRITISNQEPSSTTESAENVRPTTIFSIPGQFDSNDAMMRRVGDITNSSMYGSRDTWSCMNVYYSARDIPTIKAIIARAEHEIVSRLDRGEHIVVLGYSCGGIIGKVITDKLAQKYPSQIGLVTHHTPLDPHKGTFVILANFAGMQTEIEYTQVHEGAYPIVILSGEDDSLVPPDSQIYNKDGQPIRTREIPGTHTNPTNPIAARTIVAAIRAVRGKLNKKSTSNAWDNASTDTEHRRAA